MMRDGMLDTIGSRPGVPLPYSLDSNFEIVLPDYHKGEEKVHGPLARARDFVLSKVTDKVYYLRLPPQRVWW